MKLALLFLFISGCGKSPFSGLLDDNRKYQSTDSAFLSYVENWKNTGTENNVLDFEYNLNTIPVNFDDSVTGNRAGTTKYHITGHWALSEIYINLSTWYALTEFQRRMLIMHELGHAFFNHEHDDSISSNGKPLSLMNTSLLVDEVSNCEDEYIKSYWFRNKSELRECLEAI